MEEKVSLILYVYNGKKHKGDDGELLVKKALADYTDFKYDDPIIRRGKHGKPFFENVPVFFSISHSGGIWVCLMSNFNVGVDIQICKNVRYEKLAKRFFTQNEAEYIKKQGIGGFFEVWTKKEAFVKYTGKGFANQRFSHFSVVNSKNDDCFGKTNLKDVYIQEIDLPLDKLNINLEIKLAGAVCTQLREEIIVKKLESDELK